MHKVESCTKECKTTDSGLSIVLPTQQNDYNTIFELCTVNLYLSNVGNSGAGLDTWADSLESRNMSHNACDAL